MLLYWYKYIYVLKMPKEVHPKVIGCERVGMVMIGLLKVFFFKKQINGI